MSRNYTRKGKRTEWAVRGLKLIHIGDDVWRIGGISKKGNDEHQVIYGPDQKEYHLGSKEINIIRGELPFTQRNKNNPTDQAKAKIYILTSILDKRENWCFDLLCLPVNPTLMTWTLKVIYDNGTIKNVPFSGEFKDENVGWKTIKPIGYRIKI
jgi:hypothetical protein